MSGFDIMAQRNLPQAANGPSLNPSIGNFYAFTALLSFLPQRVPETATAGTEAARGTGHQKRMADIGRN